MWRRRIFLIVDTFLRGNSMLQRKLLLLITLLIVPLSAAAVGQIDMGQSFPEIPLPQPESPTQRAYLGLRAADSFTLSQVRAKVVLVEMLNVLCPHCRKQTLFYNKLYDMIEEDPDTRGQILMLGVAVGNSDEQIQDFVDIYAVDFPVVSDRDFLLHTAIGGGPTPFTIYLRSDPGQLPVVAGTHLGEDKQMKDLFDYLKETMSLPQAEFANLPQDDERAEKAIEPFLPPALMAQRILQSFATIGTVDQFAALPLASGRQVYRAKVDGQWLFAEILARSAICDVCHNVYFYYLFNSAGQVLSFEPLHLTRYGNVEWNDKEVAQMRNRILGRYLTTTWNFDPEIDAVASATMTSAIIFNSLAQGENLMRELKQSNYLTGGSK
jgi:peroxiredoxin